MQYSSFRDNVPYLALLLLIHPLLRRLFNSLSQNDQVQSKPVGNGSRSPSKLRLADSRLSQRISFDLCFTALFLPALHGFSVFKILIILYANYLIATRLPRQYVPTMTWIFNIGILFSNELCRGYPYAALADFILPPSALNKDIEEKAPNQNWGSSMDSYGGLIPRWEVLFKVTILRMISFNLDYAWSLERATGSPLEVCSF